jgi:hypothetical protein
MATFQWPFFAMTIFSKSLFYKAIFQRICATSLFRTALFQTALFRTALLQTALLQTAIFQRLLSLLLYMLTHSPGSYTNSFVLLLLLYSVVPSPPEMSRLSRLDSSSSSDDDDEPELILCALHQAHTQYLALNSPRWGGSIPGQNYIHRDRESGHFRLYNDYFSEHPTYGASIFRRRFVNISVNSFALFSHALSMCKFCYSHFFAQV